MKKIFFLIFFFACFSQHIQSQTRPYVLLISFDGFRWDYPILYNTPNINYLKENGVSAASLQPCFPSKTYPNHLSLITGMYTENHGIIANAFSNPTTGEEYRLGDTVSVKDPKWYKGEAFWETARKNGIVTASLFWPGDELNEENRRPDYYRHYDHHLPYENRINQIIDWLQLPYEKRPHFICSYFDATDYSGHTFGPNTTETGAAVARLDSVMGMIIGGISKTELKDSINIILVSDHGMTEVNKNKLINIEQLIGNVKCRYSDSGPVMMIYPEENEIENIYLKLKYNGNHFNVYFKKDIPEWYHYSKHPFISPIIAVADPGWSLVTDKSVEWFSKDTYKGNHGFSNFEMDMHGIFFAYGPLIKKGLKTGTLKNIDVYPLLCKIFNINANSTSDGKFENIGFILQE